MTEAQPTFSRFNRLFDAQLQLQDDATAVTGATNGTVGGSAKIVDVGNAQVMFTAVVDINSLVVATADNLYTVHIQGSTSATFTASTIILATLIMGHQTASGETTTGAVGRYMISGFNSKYGIVCRYLRVRWIPAGTGLSIDGECYLTVYSV